MKKICPVRKYNESDCFDDRYDVVVELKDD